MEATMARAIYKQMEIGKAYSTRDLSRLIGDDYYKYIPVNQHPGQPDGYPFSKGISDEMWKVVNAGLAKTYTKKETLANVRGLKHGATPKSFTDYTIRYWVRTR